MRHSLLAALSISVGLAAGSAGAGTVDLTGLPTNFDQFTFGSTGTEYYAQTVLADGTLWTDLAFAVTNQTGGSFEIEIYRGRAVGLPGTGFAPDIDLLLLGQTLTHNGGGLQNFELSPNLAVDPGSTYVFVLHAFGGTLSGASVRATQFQGPDQYAGGEFIFANLNAPLSNSISWDSRFGAGEDLAFRASFDTTAVPLPAGLPLMLSAIAAFGVTAVRRKRG